jgi:Na+/melibiose symporter-like transporter
MNRKQSLIWTLVMVIITVTSMFLANLFPENSTEQFTFYAIEILGVVLIPVGILGLINGGKPIKELAEENKVKSKSEQMNDEKKKSMHLISVGLAFNIISVIANNFLKDNFANHPLTEYITYFLYFNQGLGVLFLIVGVFILAFGTKRYDGKTD